MYANVPSMLWLRLIAALSHLWPSFHEGVATRFAAHGDAGNPDPNAACLHRSLDDQLDAIVAHRTLPCKADVLICLPRTGRCTRARVGDRGPRRAMVDLAPLVAKRLQHNGKEPAILLAWDR